MTMPQTQNVSAILADLEAHSDAKGRHANAPFATGFDPLDDALHGGFRAQDLVLIGGKPGVGKTMGTLQWARGMVLDGAHVIYACYEHTAQLLTARLLLQELGGLVTAGNLSDVDSVRRGVADFAAGWKSLEEIPDGRGLLKDAVACMKAYADRLWLVPASSASTDLDGLRGMVGEFGNGRTVLFVDYLQKVAVGPDPGSETDRMTKVAGGLKDLALDAGCLVIAVAASTHDGLTANRQRVHHLRGSSALAYEADVVIMLNEKVDAVSKVHLAYDPVKADSFRHMVVFSVEKHRGGPAGIDLEFQKDFAHARFVHPGHWVAERLVDERVFAE